VSICYHIKGGATYTELQKMPLPELFEIRHNLNKIFREEERAYKHG
jgi:hypothetical protein